MCNRAANADSGATGLQMALVDNRLRESLRSQLIESAFSLVQVS
jgi:hypothetical protein